MALNRVPFDALVDEAPGVPGTDVNKALIEEVLLDPIDAEIARLDADIAGAGGGTGTVTHTAGALTADRLLLGNGADDAKALGSAGTSATVLHGNAAGPPSFAAIAESEVTNLVADLAAKAPLASPALTGTPTAPTAAPGTNTTQLATTAFVGAAGGGLRQSFRGLHLRTHPDADKAKSQMMLVHADEVVFDDGSRATSGLDRLVADITVSGAGGLDTGSEGASRYYEVYAIRKSSDGTLNALLHRTKDWTADAQFTTARDASRALRRATSTATDKLAQGIQFATAKPFVFQEVELIRAGSVVGNVWLTLEADSAGSPSGTPLATSDKIDASLLASGNQIVRVKFRAPYTVTASTQYHLVLQGDYTRSDTVNIAWRGVAAGGYASGSAKEYNGTSWGAASGVGDFYFVSYTEQNEAALTYPTGYDAKCLIGHVYNSSGSDFVPIVFLNRLARRRDGGSIVNAGTATIPTLVSLAAVVPPVPVILRAVMFSPSGAGDVYLGSDASPAAPGEYGLGNSFSFAPNVGLNQLVDIPSEMQSVYYKVVTMANTYLYLLDYEW